MILLSAPIDAISESEFSDEELSDSTLNVDCSARLGSFVHVADFPNSLS
jgi:hypothetical protein